MNNNIERAAGGVVVRGQGAEREVLLINDAYDHITFPKGHLEPGEDWETAAVREVAEETGIETRILAPLGRVEYMIRRNDKPVRKQVRLFLLEAVDETAVPHHQAEEVRGAYYLPFDAAASEHEECGYASWSFIFQKLKAQLAWLDGQWERKWRGLANESDAAQIDSTWQAVAPVVTDLIAACREELRVTMPELTLAPQGEVSLPLAGSTPDDIRGAIEHTLLKPEASLVDIENICREAVAQQFPLVCLNPQFVSHAARLLDGEKTNVCTVIGFPFGATTAHGLAAEVIEMAAKGAREIDMVIPVGSMVEDDVWTVYHHVATVVRAAGALTPRPIIKVILETSALTFDQVIKAACVAVAAGANYIKTSTGFHRGGATIADVSAMAIIAGDVAKVKASGGVRSRTAATQMMRYGAHRLGTSSGVALIR